MLLLSRFEALGDKTEPTRVCAHCGIPLTRFTATIEHMIPKAFGGSNAKINICLTCVRCNSRKADKLCTNVNKIFPYLREIHKREYTVMLTGFLDIVINKHGDVAVNTLLHRDYD